MSKEQPKIYDVVDAWIKELSLAPMGHNKKSYLLVKAMGPKELKKILSEEDEDLTAVLEKAGLFDEGLEAGKLIGKLLKAYGDELPEEFLGIMAKAAGLDEPDEGPDTKLKEGGTGMSKAEGGKLDDAALKLALEKADPSLKELILGLHKAVTDTEARARRAEEAAQKLSKASTESYFDGLMGELKGIPGDLKPLKKALVTLNEAHPIEVGFITGALKKASEAALKGLGPSGITVSSGAGVSTAEAEIKRRAGLLMKKAPNMTEEEAMSLVLEKSPELYDQYEAERGGE